MTQVQLARVLGITERAVKYIEAGKREPRISTLGRFLELVARHERAKIVHQNIENWRQSREA